MNKRTSKTTYVLRLITHKISVTYKLTVNKRKNNPS